MMPDRHNFLRNEINPRHLDVRRNGIREDSVEQIVKKKIIESSLTGLPKIVRATKILPKIWWIFAWLCGLGLTIYFVTDSTRIYFKYEVISKSRIYDTFSMQFPKVTICNLDPFTTNASVEFLASFLRDEVTANMTEFETDQEMVSGIKYRKWNTR